MSSDQNNPVLLNQYFAQNIIQPNQVLTQETVSAGQTPPVVYDSNTLILMIPPYPVTVMSHQLTGIQGIDRIVLHQIPNGTGAAQIRLSSVAEAVGQPYDTTNSVTGTASGECYNRPLYMPPNGGKIILKIKGGTGTIEPQLIVQNNTTQLTKYYANTTNPIPLTSQTIVIIEITNITTGLPEEILSTTNDILLDFKVFETS